MYQTWSRNWVRIALQWPKRELSALGQLETFLRAWERYGRRRLRSEPAPCPTPTRHFLRRARGNDKDPRGSLAGPRRKRFVAVADGHLRARVRTAVRGRRRYRSRSHRRRDR